jgi:hypothetical protein
VRERCRCEIRKTGKKAAAHEGLSKSFNQKKEKKQKTNKQRSTTQSKAAKQFLF